MEHTARCIWKVEICQVSLAGGFSGRAAGTGVLRMMRDQEAGALGGDLGVCDMIFLPKGLFRFLAMKH